MSDGTYRALLVVNSTFPADRFNLPDLEGPRNDPVVLQAALCHETTGLFRRADVRVVAERPMPAVLREVEDFLRPATRQETLLLYYSGHGLLDQSGELFLCTHDSRVERLRSTAVKASDLRPMMDESAARAVVVVLDCCHSGRFKGGDVPAPLSGRGRFILTSTRSGELADDAHIRNHASVFTHYLAEGIVHGAPDGDGDGLVTLDDLYGYMHATLVSDGRPTPQKRFDGEGDVVIARRPPSTSTTDERAEPVLTLSNTVIDLGEVDVDEPLPRERIAVFNLGGGTLDWTVESSADWVTVLADDIGVLLSLHPVPGPNRANIYVRDTHTGALKTIRVTVRVRSPRTPPVELSAPPLEPPTLDGSPLSSAEPVTLDQPAMPAIPATNIAPLSGHGRTSARSFLRMAYRDVERMLGRDARWNLQNSSWLLLTLPLGFTTWLGFLIVGIQANQRRWTAAGVGYLAALVAIGTLFFTAPEISPGQTDADSWQVNVGSMGLLGLWIGGIVHGFLINGRWLKWRSDLRSHLVPPPLAWQPPPIAPPVDITTAIHADSQHDPWSDARHSPGSP